MVVSSGTVPLPVWAAVVAALGTVSGPGSGLGPGSASCPAEVCGGGAGRGEVCGVAGGAAQLAGGRVDRHDAHHRHGAGEVMVTDDGVVVAHGGAAVGADPERGPGQMVLGRAVVAVH